MIAIFTREENQACPFEIWFDLLLVYCVGIKTVIAIFTREENQACAFEIWFDLLLVYCVGIKL